MKIPEKITKLIDKELKKLDNKINFLLDNSLLNHNLKNNFLNSGKKLRPIFFILLCKGLGCEEDLIDYAIVIEFMHNASLIHDDIIDHSDKRRGFTTFNTKFGNNTAVFLGDYLIVYAHRLALTKGNLDIIEAMNRKGEALLAGEIEENFNSYNINLSPKKYIEIIKNKTSSLFELCSEMVSILVNADKKLKENLIKIGTYAGLSFQIIDDVLDFTSESENFGKPVINDLKEGTITLPMIYAFSENPDLKLEVEKYFNNGNKMLFEKIKGEFFKTNGISKSKEKATEYLNKAIEIIENIQVENSYYVDKLHYLLNFIVKRNY